MIVRDGLASSVPKDSEHQAEALQLPLCSLAEEPPEVHVTAEEEKKEQKSLPKSALQKAAQFLESTFGVGPHGELRAAAASHGLSYNTFLRHVHAAAELLTQAQIDIQQKVLRYCQLLAGKSLQQVLYIQWCSYDSTPLRVRVREHTDEPAKKRKAKVFVFESQWAVLFKKLALRSSALGADESDSGGEPVSKDFVLLRGSFSPVTRILDSGTALAIKDLVMATERLPATTASCGMVARLVETDQDSAVVLAEKLVAQARPGQWEAGNIHSLCNAHKLHTGAEKVWHLDPSVISGVIHCCKVMQDVSVVAKVQDAVRAEIPRRLQCYKVGTISPDARAFREHVQALFLPPTRWARRRASMEVVSRILNGDWRQEKVLIHICTPECPSDCHNQTLEALQALLPRVLSQMRPFMFSKNNWLDWRVQLNYFGWAMYLHALLRDCLLWVIAGSIPHDVAGADIPQADEAPHGDPAGDDPSIAANMEQDPQEVAIIREKRDMSRSLHWGASLWLLRASLQPQVQAMAQLLSQCSDEWEVSQMHNLLEHGFREYRLTNLVALLKKFYSESLKRFLDTTLWSPLLPRTELTQTQVFRFNFRAPSFVWQTAGRNSSSWPWPLFKLLTSRTQETAAALVGTFRERPCLLDEWSRCFMTKYSSIQDLLSEEVHQILAALSTILRGTTYPTERAHSKNSRHVSKRVQCVSLDGASLGLVHAGSSGFQFLRPPRPRGSKRGGAEACSSQPPAASRGGCSNKRKRDAKESCAASHKLRRRRGGGGAWRAFLHLHGKGRRFCRASLAALQRRYRALQAEQKEAYLNMGSLGQCHWKDHQR